MQPAEEVSGPVEAIDVKETVEEGQVCSNCGAAAQGPYCHQCGQRYTSHIAPLKTLLTEALDVVLNLDNRLWRTVRMLLFRPGALTQAYLAGQRIQYVSPLRLYLLFSLLYFFVAVLVGTTDFLFFKFDFEGEVASFGQVLPRLMFLIVPGFALLLKGLFRKPKQFFAVHLIFALHIHAMWYILFTVAALFEPFANKVVEDGVFTVITVTAFALALVARFSIPVYLFLAMRRFYGESRGRTLWKIIALYLGYFILLGIIVMVYLQLFIFGGI